MRTLKIYSLSNFHICNMVLTLGFPGSSDAKESACNAEDLDSILGLGSSPGGGHGNPLQYSCLRISMNRVAWQAAVQEVAKSQTGLK